MSTFINFFNSNFFIGLVTLVAGVVAFGIYWRQKKDQKKDAANILLLEIQNAERFLKVAKERVTKDNLLPPDIYLMPTGSWNNYKYLFVRDFDRDEWDTITAFYDKCKLYDEAVSYNNASFQKNEEQLRINMQRVSSNYVEDYLKDVSNPPSEEEKHALLARINSFQDAYLGLPPDLNLYSPLKPVNDAKLHLEAMSSNLSQTSIGGKLKSIAKLKNN